MADRPEIGDALLVVVGAGASFDCLPPSSLFLPQLPDRPPLTKDLAGPNGWSNQLARQYPDVQPLIDALRSDLLKTGPSPDQRAVTLESALGDHLEQRNVDPNVARHVIAMRFYLRDLLRGAAGRMLEANGGMTNYTTLVRRSYQWAARTGTHVCFVSFNYDPLLETACQAYFRFDPSNLWTYLDDRYASVLKPHGSFCGHGFTPRFGRAPPLALPRWSTPP
jgi:hypothetical protein